MSPLGHDDARDAASRALDGSLDRSEEQELAVHLVSCPACKMFHDNLERARDAVRQGLARRPSPETMEAAVRRATTVLRGDADPGAPRARVEEPAPAEPPAPGAEPVPTEDEELGPQPEAETEPPVREPGTPVPPEAGEPEGTRSDEDLLFDVEAEPTGAEEEAAAPPSAGPEEELPTEPGPEPPPAPDATPPPGGPPPAEAPPGPETEPAEPPAAEPIPPEPPKPADEPTSPPQPQPPAAGESPEDAAAGGEEPPAAPEELAVEPRPVDEGARGEGPAPSRGPGLRWRAGPTAVAILATVAVAVLAAVLVLNRGGGGGEEPVGDLPSPEEIRSGVGAVFDDMTSLETSYSITRLSLYRVRTEEARIVYSFSNAEQTGRVVFEDPLRLRQERTLEVPEARAVRSTVVRTPEELRMLRQDGEEETATTVANYPLGPPEGRLIPKLGVLDEAVGSVARMAQDSRELEVLGAERLTEDGPAATRVAFPVSADPFTRADRIEVLLDPQSFLPLRVSRTLSREEAAVLGPSDVLNEEAIEAAFGDRDRITTELVTLENVTLNDVVLPGEFVLDLPPGVTAETRDGGFDHDVSRAEVPSLLPFTPLSPEELPTGFREQDLAVSTGDPTAWGPDDTYPAPSGILETVYSDGKTTIVLSQRAQPDGPFELERSPLADVGEPVTTRTLVRGGIQLTYGVSPEIPPHVYGFVGDVFVLVSGYAPQEDLVRIASSLEEAPELEGADEGGINIPATPGE